MADDCPHSSHLESSLKHYYDSSPIIAATHATYLKMIGELKNELEHISTEVEMVQTECTNTQDRKDLLDGDGGGLVMSLKALETQNDRLQQALEETTQTKDAMLTKLQANNEHFKYRIQQLSDLVIERDDQIQCLTAMLNQYPSRHQFAQNCSPKVMKRGSVQMPSECCVSAKTIADLEKRIESLITELDKTKRQEQFINAENRKLHQELNESKTKNADIVAKAQQVAGLLKKQENHHLDLAEKYALLEKNFQSQAKKLKAAGRQVTELSERFAALEKLQMQNNMERDILRDEVIALKEKETAVVTSHRGLQENLAKTRKELSAAHQVIVEQRNVLDRTENAHSEMLRRLQEDNCDAKRKLKILNEDHQRLLEEHERGKQVIKQYEVILNSYKQWKSSQLKADEETRQKLQQFNDAVREKDEEYKQCMADNQNLYRDNLILQAELESARKDAFKNSPNGSKLYAAQHFIFRNKMHPSKPRLTQEQNQQSGRLRKNPVTIEPIQIPEAESIITTITDSSVEF